MFHQRSRDPAAETFLPVDDDHPCWVEIDALAEAIFARLKADRPGESDAIDGLLTTSSDAPLGCTYFWVDLPADASLRGEVLALCLEHLSRARLALPKVDWGVSLEDAPLDWDGARFSLPT